MATTVNTKKNLKEAMDLLNEVKEDKLSMAKDEVKDKYDYIKANLDDFSSEVEEKTKDIYKKVSKDAKDNPLKYAAYVGVAGLALGYILGRK